MSPCHPFRPVPGQCGPNRRGPLPAPPFDPRDYWATRKCVSQLSASLEKKLDRADVVDPGEATEAGKAADAKKTQEELGRILAKLAKKADKATTLAGYGITDAATKAELAAKADLVDGKVPAFQLPSYVDDVLEYGSKSEFPASGENGKIYVAKDTNLVYRWSGTQYVEISPSPALDNTVTESSPNGVKSSGIWSAIWGALTALPDGFSSLYDWCTAKLAALQDGKRDKTDRDTYAEEFGEWSYTFVESAGMITGETFYNDELHRWETDYSSDDYAGVTLIASGGVNAQYLDFVYPGVPRVHLVTAIRTKSLVPSGKLLAADNPIPASGTMAKFGTDGKMQVAEPSGTSQAPANADYRDPQDNTCHKTEYGEWAFGGGATGMSGLSMKYEFNGMNWFWNFYKGEDLVANSKSGANEDDTDVEAASYNPTIFSSAPTATRHSVCSEGEKFVTSDVVDGKVSSAVSTNNPAFVSAVQNTPAPEPGQGEDPPWGTWGTVGAAIAGLVAGLKWLKDKVFDSAGNIQDQFATDLLGKQVAKETIIYKANTATGLKDRAFNALSLDGTEYNLSTALAAVTPTVENQPRDLLIVATATASTTISFTAGTIKGDKPTIDGAGTWLITLTEYAANTWYCRQIKMEDAA